MISPYQQRKRAYTNVLLFVGVMALGAVAWLDNRNKLPERRTPTSTAASAESISFQTPSGVDVELRRNGDGWNLLKPITLAARVSRVERLLELQSLDFSNGYATADVNLEAAGLTPDARALVIDGNRYLFGSIEPLSSQRYLQNKERVLLWEDRYLPLIDGGINPIVKLELPLQSISAATFDSTALSQQQLMAWKNTSAMGVRVASEAPVEAKAILFEQAYQSEWSVWESEGFWILQAQQADHEYLLSGAQADTLGLNQ